MRFISFYMVMMMIGGYKKGNVSTRKTKTACTTRTHADKHEIMKKMRMLFWLFSNVGKYAAVNIENVTVYGVRSL